MRIGRPFMLEDLTMNRTELVRIANAMVTNNKEFARRARLNGQATTGRYSADQEKQAA